MFDVMDRVRVEIRNRGVCVVDLSYVCKKSRVKKSA